MKTLLVCSQKPQPPLNYYFTKPSLSPPPHINQTQTTLLQPRTTTWKLHASAKGFGGTAAAKEVVNQNKNTNNKNVDDNHLPQAVLERIILRIVVAVGVPMATGFLLMNLIGVMKEQQLWDVPRWVPAVTLFLTFGASAVGLAYGPLSASWDENRKGSLFGIEEAKQNWVEMWENVEEEEEEEDNDG